MALRAADVAPKGFVTPILGGIMPQRTRVTHPLRAMVLGAMALRAMALRAMALRAMALRAGKLLGHSLRGGV